MGIKTCKKGKTSTFIVNKQLKVAKVKFLIEHDKKEFKWCIVTLYIEETPFMNISDTSNELKQILVHNCFSQSYQIIPGDALGNLTYGDLHPRIKILPQKYR